MTGARAALLLLTLAATTAFAAGESTKGHISHALAIGADGPIGDVRAGNHVDLIALFPKGKGTDVIVLLQNVEVESVGTEPPTLTLLVTPEESAHIARYAEKGVIRVSLRSLWEGNTLTPAEKSPGASLPFAPLPMRTPRAN